MPTLPAKFIIQNTQTKATVATADTAEQAEKVRQAATDVLLLPADRLVVVPAPDNDTRPDSL